MFVKSIELTNFRNYEHCTAFFPTNKIILVGNNAQGKTNLIESIYFLATLSPLRSCTEKDLIKWGSNFCHISAEVAKENADVKLDVIINPPKHKILKLNGIKKTKYSHYLGNLLVVNFGINDLLLLRGSPSDRRKWVDDAISQIYPSYNDILTKFNRIKTHRNNLLKEFKGNTNLSLSQKEILSVWDEQLTSNGSNLIYLRQKFLREINKKSLIKHKFITKDEENLFINYDSTVIGILDFSKNINIEIKEIYDLYKEKLEKKRNEEIIRSQSLIGPHRDDIKFLINGIDALNFASQGQQRTVVLSLKLAELDFIKEIKGENPILLLDDVLAELDQSRQNFLLQSIGNEIQTIVTTVDISNFESSYVNNVTIYNINKGVISKNERT